MMSVALLYVQILDFYFTKVMHENRARAHVKCHLLRASRKALPHANIERHQTYY